MGYDPLSDFLQNGSQSARQMVPVTYAIQKETPVSKFDDMLNDLNPVTWLKNQMQSNPQMQQVMNIVNQHGGDAKAAFYEECRKRNADPNDILAKAQTHPLFRMFFK